MKNEAPYMSEEHIVAWLDGELQADAEVRSALNRDSELAAAARDHAAISRSFARSKSDARFILPAAVDTRVYAALKQELSTTRKKVATPNRIADREPIAKPSTADRMKKVWARRTSYALGLALLLGGIWFGVMNKTETPSQYSTIEQPAAESVTSAPDAIVPPPTTALDNTSTAATTNETMSHTTATNTRSSHPSMTKQIVTPAEQTTAVVATATQNVAPEAHDPAAAMISHRFAKMIKETPSVVVSQQDKMDRM